MFYKSLYIPLGDTILNRNLMVSKKYGFCKVLLTIL
nr:MAG TPA: hypothetical protein [Caudoviricetes sp.]